MAALLESKAFSTLKASQLKHLAFLTGLGVSGTKSELARNLSDHITSFQPRPNTSNLVSVDMGLRNLAICSVSVPPTTSHSTLTLSSSPSTASPTLTPLTVTSWRRSDLLSTSPSSSSPALTSAEQFHPRALSSLAYDVCTSRILPSSPARVLIERQRFRTRGGFGGGAVAEWTLRVNTFEAMMWACLTTLRRSGGGTSGKGWVGDVLEMRPDRVVAFWTAVVGDGTAAEAEVEVVDADAKIKGKAKRRRRKASSSSAEANDMGESAPQVSRKERLKLEKRDRVALVRKWTDADRGAAEVSGVRLQFEGQAAETADAFRSKKARDADGGKLDDLADCLLQAVAWVKWEENRHAIRQWLESVGS